MEVFSIVAVEEEITAEHVYSDWGKIESELLVFPLIFLSLLLFYVGEKSAIACFRFCKVGVRINERENLLVLESLEQSLNPWSSP